MCFKLLIRPGVRASLRQFLGRRSEMPDAIVSRRHHEGGPTYRETQRNPSRRVSEIFVRQVTLFLNADGIALLDASGKVNIYYSDRNISMIF
jgi:hypothetical protein